MPRISKRFRLRLLITKFSDICIYDNSSNFTERSIEKNRLRGEVKEDQIEKSDLF